MSSSFIRPPEEINTEDEALGECCGLPFEDLPYWWRAHPPDPTDPPQNRRIKEVLRQSPRKAT